MSYDRIKIFEKAKELIVENKLFFIEDIIALLPISKPTFYQFFPVESDELNILKDLLDETKIGLKVEMRSKWYDSDSPALQICLMKLICTDKERKKLSTNHTDITSQGEKVKGVVIIDWTDGDKIQPDPEAERSS